MDVLESLDQLALAVPLQRVGLQGLEGHDVELGRRRVGPQVARAAVAGGVGDAHAFDATRVVGRDGLALDRVRQFGKAEAGGQARRAFGQRIADALAVGDHRRQLDHPVIVSPGQRRVTIEAVLLRDLHVGREGVAQLDRVHAIVVALVNHLDHRVDVVMAGVGAQRPGRLILDALHAQPLVLAVLQFDLFLAGHGAGVAGGVVDQDVVVDVLAAQVLALIAVAGHLAVPRRQRAHRVGDIHQHVGAIERQAALARAGDVGLVHDDRQSAVVGLLPGLSVGRLGQRLFGLDDHGLQVLRAANAARAAPAAGPVVLVDPTGEADEMLARRADGDDGQVLLAELGLEVFDRLVDAHAPDGRGVAQFNFAILDVGVDRRVGLALEDQPVEAGPAQAGRRPTAVMAVGHGSRQGRLGYDSHPAAHVGRRPSQRAIHEAEDVIGRQRFDRWPILEYVAHTQTARADVLARPLFGDAFVFHSARRQIDVGDVVRISTEFHFPHPFPKQGFEDLS